jgi:hypothetical protein
LSIASHPRFARRPQRALFALGHAARIATKWREISLQEWPRSGFPRADVYRIFLQRLYFAAAIRHDLMALRDKSHRKKGCSADDYLRGMQ